MFTVMFALGRLPGWVGQWKEMTEKREPIGRPRQVYTGATQRPFVGLTDRAQSLMEAYVRLTSTSAARRHRVFSPGIEQLAWRHPSSIGGCHFIGWDPVDTSRSLF